MRLLNTETFQLETFVSHETSRYAILSHTWDEDETLFEDLRGKPPGPLNTGKAGDAKVMGACAKARSQGYRYVWIDTCCINKSSSAELSEAINSMFEWYRACQICYAYLSDVTDGDETAPQSSRWLTRGWTLQELIAPDEVVFCNKYWEIIGNRRGLAAHLSNLTRIDEAILHRDPGVDVNRLLAETSVAARMSWIRHRQTTRKEDLAYCLMGLFDVNMPLLYGEGTKAYTRLQQEIIKNIDDQSILAHWTLGTRDGWEGLLARVPPRSQFVRVLSSRPRPTSPGGASLTSRSITLTNAGLELRVPLLAKVLKVSSLRPPDNSTELNRTWLAVLDCHHASDFLIRPAILLEPLNGSMESGYRSFRKIGPVAWLIPPAHAAGNDLQVGAVYCNRAETLKDIETEQHPFKARWQLQAEEPQPFTIFLQDSTNDSYVTDGLTPPLSVWTTGTLRHSFRLLASLPAVRDHYVAPSGSESVPVTSFPPDIEGREQRLHTFGIAYFSCCDAPENGFFILWGRTHKLKDGDMQHRMPAIASSSTFWWDKLEMGCSVLTWSDISIEGSERLDDDWAVNLLTDSEFRKRMWRYRHLSILVPSWNGQGYGINPLIISNFSISASVATVDFLGRRAFRLNVDISQAEGYTSGVALDSAASM